MKGSSGPHCDCGNGSDGLSGSPSRMLCPPNLSSWLPFPSEPARGASSGVGSGGGGCGGGGGDAWRGGRWLLVLCGDESDLKMLLPPKTVS